jgi:hypothetical protein
MQKMLLLTSLLAFGTAHSSDWVSIGKNDNGVREFFADVSSIGITGEIRWAWIKTIVRPDKPFSLERLAFNCEEGTMRWEASTLYGIEINDSVGSYPTPWKPVPPDTVGSAIIQFICKWKPK